MYFYNSADKRPLLNCYNIHKILIKQKNVSKGTYLVGNRRAGDDNDTVFAKKVLYLKPLYQPQYIPMTQSRWGNRAYRYQLNIFP